ncbi:hypothetical protein E1B28_011419 [Marasmius oreades]|uniref:Angiogenic factor with G patch and FHA domains 1 n=1 Tax=Marasmius oreades TaxID=181124 RepID=A0A9P7UQ72_9AGAR|nr:uncharacterized protein E1B28_011419 [Marasmius oreades]KAG7089765.1 hypothetical protein E1B28_011419 [Marasmius oreades]
MEQGEVYEESHGSRPPSYRDDYDPSYEWSWDSTSLADAASQEQVTTNANSGVASPSSSNKCMSHTLRLVVSRTRCISKSRCIALLDGYTETQFGRDAGLDTVPRIRLREMEVSKLHATLYWDKSWNRWGIVDMGSKHGTFLRSAIGASTDSDGRGMRLSPAKTASAPKRLYHLDDITIGSTTFNVHIHEDGLPRTLSSRDIPSTLQPDTVESQSSKAVLSKLKRELLTRHRTLSAKDSPVGNRYIDRSACRRALYPPSKADIPGVASSSSASCGASAVEPLGQQPPAFPLSSSNVGHMLLVKQGWVPGTSLGVADEGRVDPFNVAVRHDRAGLGSIGSVRASTDPRAGQSSDLSWRKRYERWNVG